MNKLDTQKQVQVIKCLVEGNSIRSTVRMTGVAKNTVQKLLLEVGWACERYHFKNVKGLQTHNIQCDEIWAYCYAKRKNVPEKFKHTFGYGDVWTFTAIDRETKLCVSWLMGDRSTETAVQFFLDLRNRIEGRIQISTDAFKGYELAIEALQDNVDYGVLVKFYGNNYYNQPFDRATRYSPNEVSGYKKTVLKGNPDEKQICTSHVERANLTMRMSMRRFTRLTNGFSKKLDNMQSAVALHFMHYNFCRVHQTLRITPAMQAGLTDHIWEIEEILNLLKVKV